MRHWILTIGVAFVFAVTLFAFPPFVLEKSSKEGLILKDETIQITDFKTVDRNMSNIERHIGGLETFIDSNYVQFGLDTIPCDPACDVDTIYLTSGRNRLKYRDVSSYVVFITPRDAAGTVAFRAYPMTDSSIFVLFLAPAGAAVYQWMTLGKIKEN